LKIWGNLDGRLSYTVPGTKNQSLLIKQARAYEKNYLTLSQLLYGDGHKSAIVH
jgi:hypothetical protein